MSFCRDDPQGALLDVLLQPRASRESLGPVHGDRLKVAVKAPPVEGEANEALVRLLARQLGLPRSAVTIRSGLGSRRKTVQVKGMDAGALQAKVMPQVPCDHERSPRDELPGPMPVQRLGARNDKVTS